LTDGTMDVRTVQPRRPSLTDGTDGTMDVRTDLAGFVAESSIHAILDAMPADWRGTTFNNTNLLGRETFACRLGALLESGPVTTEALERLGNAEDYLRVATNVSTMLEAFLARRRGYDVSAVFTFASRTLPVVAVLLTCDVPRVRLYHGVEPPPFKADELLLLATLGAVLVLHAGSPPPLELRSVENEIVLALDVALPLTPRAREGAKRQCTATVSCADEEFVHAVIASNVLYITDTHLILPAGAALVRKRLATPATTPMAEAMLRAMVEPARRQPHALVGASATGAAPAAEPVDVAADIAGLHSHLQELCGNAACPQTPPHLFTAGLSALTSLWLALLHEGGAEIVMSATAYGGSSQLTDLLTERTAARATDGRLLRKHTFDVAGAADLVGSVATSLAELGRRGASSLLPTTVLFIELPTNPDMKVPCIATLVSTAIAPFVATVGTASRLLLLLDTTLAPCSAVLRALRTCAPELAAVAFLSLSKSVSRGLTTAGALVPNHTSQARAIMRSVAYTTQVLDVSATADQIATLVGHHRGVEQRCRAAYEVAATVGHALCGAVRAASGHEMRLSFVSAEQAQAGFHTSTFSFNLPPPVDASEDDRANLAQYFVTQLTTREPTLFKPCVSFGQDNGKVYCTVPATSTQGAIRAEDKAKQAVGGVQLVRLSFPPTIDTHAVCRVIADIIADVYSSKQDATCGTTSL